MNLQFNIIKIFLLLLGFSSLQSQSKVAFLTEADKAFAQQNYHGALVYYEEALTFDNADSSVVYKVAESARLYNAYGFAVGKYHYLLDTLKSNDYPDAVYRLGEMYQKLGRYDEAIQYFNQYLSEYSNSDMKLTAGARRGITSCTKAKDLVNKLDDKTTITRLGIDVNSPDADFGASDRMGKMYFSSLKYESAAKALKYKQIAKTLIKSENAPAEIILGYVNSRDKSVANFAFNLAGNKVYYSICDYVNGWSQSCEIYVSDVDGSGNLANEQKLGNQINLPGSNNTQPSPGLDITTGQEGLYFVSDRAGGSGGKDIWFSRIENGGFADPVNLKAINTDCDEITPFYFYSSLTLFFSSEGREGFGGFDIFEYSQRSEAPNLLAAPTNSSMNDMYYFLNPAGNKGYVTSNRAGSSYQYDSYEACCMDIYAVDINTDITLDVLTFLQSDGSDLNGTTICLLDDDTGKEIQCITNSPLENIKSFVLAPNKKYKVIATKVDYTKAMERFRTTPADRKLVKKLYLAPDIVKLEVYTFEDPSKEMLPGTTVTLTDLTDGSVKEIVVTNSLGNDFKFDIIRGRKYKITAIKDGYVTASESFGCNCPGETIVKKLYLPSMLPLSLYFDNDYPNPRSKSASSTKKYLNLADDYLKRQPDYITKFISPLPDQEKKVASNEIELFFKNDVAEGKNKLLLVFDYLTKVLGKGDKIELEVRGFASPRAKTFYNKKLSKRRIRSVKNDMIAYNGGVLKKYLDNKSLILKDVSLGESAAKPGVVDDLKDERNSIYNLNAARERRVEILKINYKK